MDITNVLFWVILGGIAGWIASKLTGTDGEMGLGANILVGIAGGLIGGFVFQMFGGAGVTGFNIWSLLVAVIGSVILLVIVKAVRGHSRV